MAVAGVGLDTAADVLDCRPHNRIDCALGFHLVVGLHHSFAEGSPGSGYNWDYSLGRIRRSLPGHPEVRSRSYLIALKVAY